MIGQFLIYSSEADAFAKAEEEGRARFPTGWSGETTTKYVSLPDVTHREEGEDATYALEVSNYTTLTQEETEAIQAEVLFSWEVEDEE